MDTFPGKMFTFRDDGTSGTKPAIATGTVENPAPGGTGGAAVFPVWWVVKAFACA